MSRLDWCKSVLLNRDCYDWKNDNCDGCNIFKAYCEGARMVRRSIIHCKDCLYWQDNNGGYPHANCRWCETETPDADDYCSGGATEQTYKLSGYDEVIEALDNLKLEFTIHGTEWVKRMVGDDHE